MNTSTSAYEMGRGYAVCRSGLDGELALRAALDRRHVRDTCEERAAFLRGWMQAQEQMVRRVA